jgi:hypothetical protein
MANKNTGASRPDMTKGNKVEPTTKVPKPKKPHAGHGHKGKTT